LCLNEKLVSEISLQPIKRFDIDAVILFSDILIIPYGLGQKVFFKKNFGPLLNNLDFDLIIKAKMTKEATKKCLAELKKLKSMSSMSAEATVVRNYLDWMVELPWNNKEKQIEKVSIVEAKKILDEDHYGLEKVKERILEYLAVQKRVGKIKGAILCLVGPPGVGKTSLGKSIARSTGRKFVRMSLGGIRDEAEIR